MKPKPTFYLASRLDRQTEMAAVVSQLKAYDFEPTHDWTTHGDVRSAGLERIQEVADREATGAIRCDVFCLALPGGNGAYTEFGLAIAVARITGHKLVVVHSEHEEELRSPTGTGKIQPFFFLPNVHMLCCPLDVLALNIKLLYEEYTLLKGVALGHPASVPPLRMPGTAPSHSVKRS